MRGGEGEGGAGGAAREGVQGQGRAKGGRDEWGEAAGGRGGRPWEDRGASRGGDR